MTDHSFFQAHTDAEAGHVRQAIEGLRRVLERDPADADAVALLNILLIDVFAQASRAYDGDWLGQAAWCFTRSWRESAVVHSGEEAPNR